MKKSLSPGEAFFIARRRKGISQTAAADKHGVTVHQVSQWEADIVPNDRDGKPVPCPKVGLKWKDLTPGEQCIIMRQRSGQSRVVVASNVGVSANWLSAMENGREAPDRLLRYWNLNPQTGA